MKHYAFSLVLAVLLLVSGIAGFGGCSHPNPLTAIMITVPAPVIAKGTSHQLYVTAIFSNRLAVPAWSQVTWTSSDPAVATVSATGIVLGVTAGTADITATDISHPSITHSVTAYVTDLQSITITGPVSPAVMSVSTGTMQFKATGIYSADTPTAWNPVHPDITSLVSWASTSTSVAVVGNIAGMHGVATAVSAGTTTITATNLATGITGTAILTVVP